MSGEVRSPTILKITGMLARGIYAAPDRYDNLHEGLRFCVDTARDKWAPFETRVLLRKWIEDANRLLAMLETEQHTAAGKPTGEEPPR